MNKGATLSLKQMLLTLKDVNNSVFPQSNTKKPPFDSNSIYRPIGGEYYTNQEFIEGWFSRNHGIYGVLKSFVDKKYISNLMNANGKNISYSDLKLHFFENYLLVDIDSNITSFSRTLTNVINSHCSYYVFQQRRNNGKALFIRSTDESIEIDFDKNKSIYRKAFIRFTTLLVNQAVTLALNDIRFSKELKYLLESPNFEDCKKLAIITFLALVPQDNHFNAFEEEIQSELIIPIYNKYCIDLISKKDVWAAGKQWYEQAKKEGNQFSKLIPNESILPSVNSIEVNDEKSKGPQKLLTVINNSSDHLYLIGEGGIGKTTALFSIMEGAYCEKSKPIIHEIPLYIDLSRANNHASYSNGSFFILRSIQELLPQYLGNPLDWEKQIVSLLSKRKGEKPEFTLLLDGLNEVSRETKNNISIIGMLTMEIRHIITHYENVRVILTSRSKESALGGKIKTLFLSGIKQENVKKYLKEKKFSEDKIDKIICNKALEEILRIPLFLTFFAESGANETLLTRGEILHTFFTKIKTDKYTERGHSTQIRETLLNEKSEIYGVTPSMLSFILDFILPEIAWGMVNNKNYQISIEEITEPIKRILTSISDTDYCGNHGRKLFKEYHDESDSSANTLREAKNLVRFFRQAEENGQMQWEHISTNICDYLIMQLGMLKKISYGEFKMHEHIRDYFAALHHINKLKLAVYLFNNKEINEDYRRAQARLCLSEWSEPLPGQVLTFMGEALGEAHNAPHYEITTNSWVNTVSLLDEIKYPERTLVRRGLEVFRDQSGKFDNNNSQAVWILFQILKLVRRDLSGEDFTYLDLSLCRANGYRLGNENFGAKLTGSKLTNEFFLPALSSKLSSANFSLPDGKCILLSFKNDVVKVLDSNTFLVLGTLNGRLPQYSPDGRQISTILDAETIMVWDAKTFGVLGTLKGRSFQYSRDGKHIVTICLVGVKIWDAVTLTEIGTLYDFDIYSAQYSPNGKYIITDSGKYTADIWDAESYEKLRTIRGRSPQCSPDGQHIATSTSDGMVVIWDINNIDKTKVLPGYNPRFSPDGQRIITLLHQTSVVWNAVTLDKIGTLLCDSSCQYSPNGKYIISVSDRNKVDIWDSENFDKLKTLDCFLVQYSPDEKYIISVSEDSTTKVLDASTFIEIDTLYVSYISSAQYSPDGKYIITNSDKSTVNIWDSKSFVKLGTLEGHFSKYIPDLKYIITDSGEYIIYVWHAELYIKLGIIEGHFSKYIPDLKLLITDSGENTIYVWDAKSFIKLGILEGHFYEYNPDTMHIFTTLRKGAAIVWDAVKLTAIGIWKGYYPQYSPGRKHFVATSWYETVDVRDANSFVTLGTLDDTSPIYPPRYSPDGKYIIISSDINTVDVWDAKFFVKLKSLDGYYLQHSPDSEHMFSVSEKGKIDVWDAKSFVKLKSLDGYSLQYSPDKKYIITYCKKNTLSIWDAKTLVKLRQLDERFPQYSPDGKYIVTVSDDGAAKVWDAETFRKIHTINNLIGVEVHNVDVRNISCLSIISSDTLNLLKDYGAIIQEDCNKQHSRKVKKRLR